MENSFAVNETQFTIPTKRQVTNLELPTTRYWPWFIMIHQQMHNFEFSQLYYFETLQTSMRFDPCEIIIRECVHQMILHYMLKTVSVSPL
jgi:hypothetical protein